MSGFLETCAGDHVSIELRFWALVILVISLFLGWFKVEWNPLSRGISNAEIKVRLFVAFGVLLPPQYQQKGRKLRMDNLRPVDLRVTSRTESDHQMQHRLARFAMMDSRIRITAHPAGVSIAL